MAIENGLALLPELKGTIFRLKILQTYSTAGTFLKFLIILQSGVCR
jgi:hypothetical protein